MTAAASGGRRKRKREEAKLVPGESVEVLSFDEGLLGSWHEGVVISCGHCSRVIEYSNMLSDDHCSKLLEMISVSPAIEGLSTTMAKRHRCNIRPLPPPYELQEYEIRYGLCVDALVNDFWWEGVVFDHNEGLTERLVFFPDQGDQQMITVDRMRMTQDWNEVTGCWNARGDWMMLRVLQKFEQEDALPVSIREIWYDLRAMDSFHKRIGVWTSGSQSEWHSLVSELIQELISVVFGLTVSEKIALPLMIGIPMDSDGIGIPTDSDGIGIPTDSDSIGIPMEDLPCLEGKTVRTEDGGEHGRFSFAASLAHDPSIDDSSRGKCHSRNYYPKTVERKGAERLRNRSCEKADIPPNDGIYFSHQPGYSPKALSDFIFECRIRVGPRPPHLRKRFNVVREIAKSHLLAVGWKLKKSKSYKYYVSPDGKSFSSLIKACEAWQERESSRVIQSTITYNAVYDRMICDKKDAETNINIVPNQSKAVGGRALQVAKSWKPVHLEAECCPQAIAICAGGLKDGKPLHERLELTDCSPASVRLKVKKHLLTLGWRIESKRDKMLRFRFISPEGKCFYSCNEVCHYLLNEQQMKHRKCRDKRPSDEGPHRRNSCVLFPAKDNFESMSLVHSCATKLSCHQVENSIGTTELSAAEEERKTMEASSRLSYDLHSNVLYSSCTSKVSSTKVLNEKRHNDGNISISRNTELFGSSEKKSHREEVLEPQSMPEAIVAYKDCMESYYGSSKRNCDTTDVRLLRLNAKNHLLCKGWGFSVRVRGARKWAAYGSPDGKYYYSLYAACKAYVAYVKAENSGSSVARLCQVMHQVKGPEDQSNNARSEILINKDSSFSASSPALGGRMLSRPSVCSIKQKPKKKKKTKARRRRSLKSDGSFLPYTLRSGNRSPHIMVSSRGQHATRTVLSWLVDKDVVLPRQKVRYIDKRDGNVMREGRITRDGIKCECCKRVYSLTNFEVHAGSSTCRPAANIFLQDGRSLLECQIQMMLGPKPKDIHHVQFKNDRSLHESDALCTICNYGGKLLLCDLCPSSFHLSCIGLEDVPRGKWFCPPCRCGVCGLSEFNRDDEHFTDKTMRYCHQCERQYHVGCMGKRGFKGLRASPIGKWFCSKSCSKIFRHLQKLVGMAKPTGAGLSLSILRSSSAKGVGFDELDVETMADHHSKLCVALDVLHECFVTMIEPRTQSDLVADLLFNNESELKRLNFRGFYTMLLQKGDELLSVAVFRVYGAKVAEMPLVGTRVQYRRQGMCRLLVGELEKLLSVLGVERLLLPAVPQLLQTWTTSFGFAKMSSSERLKLLDFTFLSFQDTTMCQKLLNRANAVSEKPKGNCNQLRDWSSSNIKNSDSKMLCRIPGLMETVDLGDNKENCFSGEGDSSGRIIPQTVRITLDGQLVVKICPVKSRESGALIKESPLPVPVKQTADVEFNSPGRCSEHSGQSGTSSKPLVRTRDVGPPDVFKCYYRRKISTNQQPSLTRV